MTRREFTDRVLLSLGRLTREEREAVRRELEEHVEDRMEALLEMGWAAELAEARCLEAMGDPAEIGRELAKQYRGWGWLWLGRAAVLLTAVLCVQAALGLGMLSDAWNSLEARFRTEEINGELDTVEVTEAVDIRAAAGNDVLRVYQICLGEKDGRRAAAVSATLFDRLPFGVAAGNFQGKSTLKNERGETGYSKNGSESYGAGYATCWTYLEPGDACVFWEYQPIGLLAWQNSSQTVYRYQEQGETVRLEIPLPGREETP